MAEGDVTNNDAADATAGGEGQGGGQAQRPGDWNPGEHSGGGGELY